MEVMFRLGPDASTCSFFLTPEKVAQMLWILGLANARLCAFRKSTSPFWAFVVYKIKELDKVIRFRLSDSFSPR